jgi:hypothetical protein
MRRPAAIMALVTTVVIVAAAGSARAGTYQVVACGDAPARANNSWVPTNSAPTKLETGNGCDGSDAYSGLYARDVLAVPDVSAGASSSWTFIAPASTHVTVLSYERWLYKDADDNWQPALEADGGTLEQCAISYPAVSCAVGAQGGSHVATAIPNASSLAFGVRCSSNPSGHCGNGGTLHAVVAVLYGATVTLSDSSAPSLSGIGGPLFAGGYLVGSRSASFDAADNVGIRSARLYVDGVAQAATTYSCDFTYAVPCSDRPTGELVLDTRNLPDGLHNVQVAASDPAGNEAKSSAHAITVDNGAPAAPRSLAVDGGEAWRADNAFSVSWTNPAGQVAPITVAHYEVCSSDGTGCQPERRVVGPGVSRIDNISVPATGEWRLKVWLEDSAGNSSPGSASVVLLRYGVDPASASGAHQAPIAPSPVDSSVADPAANTGAQSRPKGFVSPIPRASSTLRLRSARYSHGRLVLVGRIASGASGALTIRVGATALRRRVRGGSFRLVLRVHRAPRAVQVRYLGSPRFLPARASRRVRRTVT